MIQINRHILRNGLHLVHTADYTTQMVALNIVYRVGARNEKPERTGFAHLFEHLMFGGSEHIPDYDTPVQQAGGENNAFTTNDLTNYYLTVPYQNVQTAFWLESDRMLGLAFSQHSLDVQRNVVIEEFKQRYLNQPYGDVSHLMRAMAYKQHPYRWPTIGLHVKHIEEATLDEVKDFFYRFYAPNNAVLAVTGHISFEEAVQLTEYWFGDIPRREIDTTPIAPEPLQTAPRFQSVTRAVPVDALYMAFHHCDRLHADYYACDMLSDILSNGQSSRLTQHLVMEKGVCTSVDAYISGSVDAGLLQIVAKPAQGVSLATVEQAVWEELSLLQTKPIDGYELEKVKNRYESSQIFGNLHYLNVAMAMAYYETFTTAEDINREVERYRAVTAEQLMRVAQTIFTPNNCCTLHYCAQQTEA